MGLFDVSLLGAFVAACEQQHEHVAARGEVDAVSGSDVEPHLADRASHGFDVAERPAGELAGVEPGLDGGFRLAVPEFLEPLAVFGGLLDFHTLIVSHRLHYVKPGGRWNPSPTPESPVC